MDRRDFLTAMLAACTAPAVIPAAHASRLMRIKPVIVPSWDIKHNDGSHPIQFNNEVLFLKPGEWRFVEYS